MRSEQLTREQARALKNKLQPMLRYLSRLKRRMTYRGFPTDDRLLNAVIQAENALHALSVEIHYLCVGKPTEPLSQPNDQTEKDSH